MNVSHLAILSTTLMSSVLLSIALIPSEPDLDPQQVAFADHCLKSGMQPQIKGQFVICKHKGGNTK